MQVLTKNDLRLMVPLKRHPLELTALLYLKDALKKERYEECAAFIDVACEFGASAVDISIILERRGNIRLF